MKKPYRKLFSSKKAQGEAESTGSEARNIMIAVMVFLLVLLPLLYGIFKYIALAPTEKDVTLRDFDILTSTVKELVNDGKEFSVKVIRLSVDDPYIIVGYDSDWQSSEADTCGNPSEDIARGPIRPTYCGGPCLCIYTEGDDEEDFSSVSHPSTKEGLTGNPCTVVGLEKVIFLASTTEVSRFTQFKLESIAILAGLMDDIEMEERIKEEIGIGFSGTKKSAKYPDFAPSSVITQDYEALYLYGGCEERSEGSGMWGSKNLYIEKLIREDGTIVIFFDYLIATQSLAEYPRYKKMSETFGSDSPMSLITKMEFWLEKGYLDKTLEEAKKFQEQFPDNANIDRVRLNIAKAHSYNAIVNQSSEPLAKEAFDDFFANHKGSEYSVEASMEAGNFYASLNEFDLAIQQYNEVPQDSDYYTGAALGKAAVLDASGKASDSREAYEELLSSLDEEEDKELIDRLNTKLQAHQEGVYPETAQLSFNVDIEIQNKIIALAGKYGVPETLALGIANQESQFKHLNDQGQVLEGYGGGDWGMMQINDKPAAGWVNLGCFDIGQKSGPCDVEECIGKTVKDVDSTCNMAVGINILKLNYKDGLDRFPEGRLHTCTGNHYSGWDYAVRGYNGWGCKGGDLHYVTNIQQKMQPFIS
ncbi:hypothetical protein ACFL0W_05120 [Nanoarchaeota archaeon]